MAKRAKPKKRGRTLRPPSAAALAHARQVQTAIERQVPVPYCELRHESPWQLLVATILSAQSTDKMVNQVTPELFAAYPTPKALAEAPQEDVERLVHRTGFFRNKARAIRDASRHVVERFGGEVPRDMASLLTLPGVARKTANVVLGTAYGVAEGIVIDVHGIRVANRLGLTKSSDPVEIEQTLTRLWPRDEWIALGHRLTLHGRYTCLARRPKCEECALAPICPSAELPATALPSAGPTTARPKAPRKRQPTRGRAVRPRRARGRR